MGNSCTSKTFPPSDYIVHVRTGDYKGAGTNANVYIVLHNDKHDRSRELQLDHTFKDDFERGKLNRFPIYNLANFGSVVKIELWQDGSGIKSDWYVDLIEILNPNSKQKSTFPVQRWITDQRLVLQEFDCSLPQYDPHPEQRHQELNKKRMLYQFVCKAEGLPPQVKETPPDEEFSDDHKWDIVKNKTQLLLQSKIINMTASPWQSLDDLTNVYRNNLPKPAGVDNWKKDVEFGAQRLTGCNPTMIRRCDEIPENFGVTNEMMKPILQNLTLEEAINLKRLYITNYCILENLCLTEKEAKICCPIALFFVNDEKKLVPVAIQLNQDKNSNPVFLPTDPEHTWMLAKMHYNVSDASIHQSCTHLGFSHLVMESVCVCTHRNLSQSHPMFRLLAPHFMYLIAINSRALSKLVIPGGWVDCCMTIGHIGMYDIIKKLWANWRLDVQGTLPKDLEDRGVMDTESLPNYHYRDDAILLYDAIKNYVTRIVQAHYGDPDNILNDNELQSWAKELTTPVPEGFGIQGVPGNGQFTSTDEIIVTLASMIFISSVGHAASNFSQYDEYGFPPNYPCKLLGDPPTSKEALSEKDVLSQLPNKQTTLDIMVVTRLLSDRGTNALTDFEIQYQYDKIGVQAVIEFKKELRKIGDIISERNKSRGTPYTYLHPSEIPNSISI
ncbi:allene oxide synthase-lipoxygenase protein-like [Glandiceps talaboti]